MFFHLFFYHSSQLQDRWYEPKKVIEISFDTEFVSHLPWGPLQNIRPVESIQVERLCHVTHRKNARQIRPNIEPASNCTFNAGPKKGKLPPTKPEHWRSGIPLGHSYRCQLGGHVPNAATTYQFVSEKEFLFPKGSYSWWSIDTPDARQRSYYGTRMFSVGLPEMLCQFRLAHATDENKEPAVIFKKYGTLRYKREICYVIIVCADSDDLTHVKDLPPVTEEGGHVTLNGMLDANGIVINDSAEFMYNRLTSIPNKQNNEDWEHLVFGFYFSQVEGHSIILKNSQVEYVSKIPEHYCTRTQKLHNQRKWVCPDKLDVATDDSDEVEVGNDEDEEEDDGENDYQKIVEAEADNVEDEKEVDGEYTCDNQKIEEAKVDNVED